MNNQKKYNIFLTIFFTFIFSFLAWYSLNNFFLWKDVKNIIKNDNNLEKTVLDKRQEDNNNYLLEKDFKDFFLDKDIDLTLFWRVYNIIKQNYYWVDWLNKQELVYSSTKWLVEWLGDKFSEFMTPEENQEFLEALNWDFEWIWAVVNKVEMWVEIDRVLKWSPAQKSWLLKGDIIVKAWDIELIELSLYDSVDKIKWEAWTKVILNIFRPWDIWLFDVEVTREKITIPSVWEHDIFDENIAYISLNMFWSNTVAEFEKELYKVDNEDIKWLIIDLRDNWWWYLESAVDILSKFLENWELIVTTKYRDNLLNRSYYSRNSWEIFDKPILVLINSNSASASEIMAWALKDHNIAIILWEKSYGKWSVQEPFSLSDGSMLKITIAKWYTPLDKNIDQEWIEPDIKVEFEKEDFENKYDRQLEEAKIIMKKYIELWSIGLTIDSYNEKILEEKKSFMTWSLKEK